MSDLNRLEARLWDLLATGAHSLENMVRALGVEASVIVGALLTLEMAGKIRRLPTYRYERRAP